jgi:hypothetical protein
MSGKHVSDALTVALDDIGCLIELASEGQAADHPGCARAAGRGAMSTARDIEGAMLERCLQIVTTPGAVPRDQAEANVCRLAGVIVDGRYPVAGKRLSDAAATYFADHPEQQVPAAEVVRRG